MQVRNTMSLHFSTSIYDNCAASTSRSKTHNRKWHTSSSSHSSSPTQHRHRRSSPVETAWVPAETSKTNLSHLVGSSKFSTIRSYDDSRVNPERQRNLSYNTADENEMFGPTLPPAEEADPRQSTGSDSSDTERQEAKGGRRRTSKSEENSVSAKQKTNRHSETGSVPRSSFIHGHKIRRSRDSSSTSQSSRSSHPRSSSSSTSSSPVSKSKQKLSQTKSRSSVSVSRYRRRISGTRRSGYSSYRSSSRTRAERKRVRHSTSSSSRSSGSSHRSIPDSNTGSRKGQFKAQNGRRKDRQHWKRDSYAGHVQRGRNTGLPRQNLSFNSRRKSRSNSQDRSVKNVPVHQGNWSGRKGEGFDHQSRKNSDDKESEPTTKSNVAKVVHTETWRKRLANYSSSDDDKRTKTARNPSNIAQKSSTVEKKLTESKKPTSSHRSETAVTAATGRDKDAAGHKTKTDDKPKETLEDMELFLKQLKANKQQMLKKQ